MKRLFSIAISILSVFGLWAGAPAGFLEVADYLEPFSKSSVKGSGSWGDPTGPFAPSLGWDHLKGEWEYKNNTYTVSYTASSSGKEGYCIGNTENQLRKAIGEEVYHPVYDLLITPQVKGKLSFWLKPYSTAATSKPCVSFFKMHRQADGTFTFDAAQDSIAWAPAADMTASTWYEQQLDLPGDDYQYVGIRLSRVYLDEVNASYALLPENPAVQWGTVTMLPGYSSKGLKADSEGNIEVGLTATLTNTGNISIPAGKKAFLMRVKTTSPYEVDAMPLGETALPELAPGETGSVSIVTTFKVPTDIPLSDGRVKFRVDFWEDFTRLEEHTSASDATQIGVGPTLEVAPYSGILSISYSTKSTAGVNITRELTATSKPVYYGGFKGSREKTFELKNSGAAPLVITGTDKPRWIELPGTSFPLTIQPDETQEVVVKLGGPAGQKTGNVVFLFEGSYVANTIPVAGEVVPENHFFADFEEEGAFNQWYAPTGSDSWSVQKYDSSLRSSNESIWLLEPDINDYYLQNNRNNEGPHAIYSPKMTFAEGDSISFYAAKRMAGGSYTKVVVSYSKDRSNWTEIATITPQNEDPALEFYYTSSPTTTGQYIFKRFAFPMPAGDYYISFGCGNSNIDNFHGGELCNVGADLISETATAGYERTVNHPLSFTASFKNLNTKDLLPSQQRVTLYADGKAVATAAPDTIGSFATVNYQFEYYPHEAGKTVLYAEVTVGEEHFSSANVEVTIRPESLEVENTVGRADAVSEMYPVNLYYKFARSEFVYTASDLADMEGNRILRLVYPYYKTADTKTVGTFRIWMQNTSGLIDEETAEFTPDEEMTLVYEGNDIEVLKGGSGVGDMLPLEFVLDTPFDYDGENLRVVVEGLNIPFAKTYFGEDSARKRPGLYRQNDSESNYPTSKIYNSEAFPVVTLFTEKELSPVVGTVRDAAGVGISGAQVVAESGNVVYSAMTEIDGSFSLVIYQDDLDYTLTVTADGYKPYSGSLNLEGENSVVLESGSSDLTVRVSAAYEGYSVEGLEVEVYPLDYDGAIGPQALDAEGVAVFPGLTHGAYAIYIDGSSIGLSEYEDIEYSHEGDTPLEIVLDEVVIDPFNLNVNATENEEDGTYLLTVEWNRRGDYEQLLPYVYTVVLAPSDADMPQSMIDAGLTQTMEVSGTSCMFEAVTPGEYVVSVQGTTPSGASTAPAAIAVSLEAKSSGIGNIGNDGEAEYFDLDGRRVDHSKTLPGIYVRVVNGKSSKVIVK